MKKFRNLPLRERLTSDQNIYLAIYSVESYIFNKELLSKDDLEDLYALRDKFNISNLKKWVISVRKRINDLIDNKSSFIEVEVYFKPKKYNCEMDEVVFRPLHIANLLDQIASVAMLNMLIYDFDDNNNFVMSDISRLIPHNFFGNRISSNPEILFKPWTEQYKTYTSLSNELFAQYHESHEYMYEVNLDLKDFFPSIDPRALYIYICSKLPINLKDEEETLYKILIEKLLFSIVTNLKNSKDKERYYKGYCDYTSIDKTFVLGIAQGMPQAYLFANLCMIEVEKIYNEEFKGRNLFYVDDSVIFTNNISSDIDFSEMIQRINGKIQNWIDSLLINTVGISYELIEFNEKINYKITVHEAGKKSTYTNIKDSNEGEIYLRSIGRETSKAAFDLNTSYSDEESIMLKNKLNTITEVIQAEIQRVALIISQEVPESDNCITESNKAYLQKLVRYRKFFKYRKTEMQYREDNDIETIRNQLIDDLSFLKLRDKKIGLSSFFEKYNEDILGATIGFIFKNSMNPVTENTYLIKMIVDLNKLLFGTSNKVSSYLYKSYYQYIKNNLYEFKTTTEYDSLISLINAQFPTFRRKNESFINKYMINKLKEYKNDNVLNMVRIDTDLLEMMSLVNANSDEIRRKILNTIFSYGFQIELNDSFAISKLTNRKITYGELRVLTILRNYRFNYQHFIQMADDLTETEFNHGIDYTILQVLKICKTFVKDPLRIDNLILVHKYTCDVWKNGSKYLYFYTLHNQEHAVDLIKNSIKIVRAIDYIQISKNDYYILFLSCYLHDISMVTLPSFEILQEDRQETNRMAYDFINELRELKATSLIEDVRPIKKLLKDFYKKMEAFYEGQVRKNHAKDSGREIRYRRELDFIDNTLREIVAEVSEAHGFDAREVYLKKSIANKSLVSKKFTQIILRLADLLDMSSYRVSKTILNHNLYNMTELSAFHWLSHLITDGYELITEYKINELDPNKITSHINIRNITEIITLKIHVNLSQLTKEFIKCKCQNVRLDCINSNSLELTCGEPCTQTSCNFLCKWFVIKNEYLFTELQALNRYLNSLPDNYYASKIRVELDINDRTRLSEQEFGIIREHTNRY